MKMQYLKGSNGNNGNVNSSNRNSSINDSIKK